VKIAHVDKLALGQRLAQAREDAGMTQDGLGRAVGLDRTAITRLEKGERRLSVPELVAIANVLGRTLSHFVDEPVPAVVSRRRDTVHAHDTTRALDTKLGQFAADVRTLLDLKLVAPTERPAEARTSRDHAEAERMAATLRSSLGLGNDPVGDLGATCERLGLYTFSAPLGQGGPDGGCVEVSAPPKTLGAAVINGDAPPGRRRMTLAHELGHWVCGDAYDSQASPQTEKMINSFAIHFLAPRAGVNTVWNQHVDWHTRDRALAVGASFRLSWSAAILHLRNVSIITPDEHRTLSEDEPRSGDYLRLGLSWVDELASPYISPGFATACVNGYVSGRLTSDRTVELLRETLAESDLPRQDAPSLDDLRSAFMGHDG
jgi:transcriptional regulator with XRE-family HTH domain/Zn-dependent peptidase ImmA (M78 family)